MLILECLGELYGHVTEVIGLIYITVDVINSGSSYRGTIGIEVQ